jgi:hypothetical protein
MIDVGLLPRACTRCATPVEDGDLRCAVCALVLAAPATPVEVARAQVVRCDECFAAVAFVAEVQAPRCRFCGAVAHVEEVVDPVERAEVAVPFTVSRADAEGALRGWLGRRRWLAPGDLASGAVLASLEPIHWAGWVIDARALVSWAADSDAGHGTAAWAPHSGQTTMDFDRIVVPASRGLTWDECAKLVPWYQLGTAAPVGSDDTVEAFEAQRSAARRAVMAAIEATAVSRLPRGHIPGKRFRNVRVGVLLQGLRTRRVALPAWVLAYRYRGRLYRAVAHGQSSQWVLGKPPVSVRRVAALVAAIIATIATITLTVAY